MRMHEHRPQPCLSPGCPHSLAYTPTDTVAWQARPAAPLLSENRSPACKVHRACRKLSLTWPSTVRSVALRPSLSGSVVVRGGGQEQEHCQLLLDSLLATAIVTHRGLRRGTDHRQALTVQTPVLVAAKMARKHVPDLAANPQPILGKLRVCLEPGGGPSRHGQVIP
jgi:hypothetical protein